MSQVRGARPLRGDRATHRRAMHQAALGHVVVLDRPMLDHAVVPHQHVARAPLMAYVTGTLLFVDGGYTAM